MEEKEIAEKIKIAGGKLYAVGGALRDKIIGKQNYDEDYCVVGITAKKFKEIFPQSFSRGKSFEVFDFEGKEFAMARTERKTGKGHKEFKIKTGENITIEEDLARRDITINSIAQNVLTKEIIDPFNGIQDIKNKIIRATTEAFSEDPLRVYRVARFVSSLNFTVEENTIKLMNELKTELSTLSKERVFVEFTKALKTEKPSLFFEVLRQANVLDIHFKEINDLIGVEQPKKYHPEGDAYTHTMLVLDYASKETPKLEIRYSALVHDLGKGLTPKEEYPHHYNHEINGVELVNKLSNRIGVPNNWRKCGKTACREHMRGGIFYKMKPSTKIDFIERVSKSQLGLEGLQIVVNADRLSSQRANISKSNLTNEVQSNLMNSNIENQEKLTDFKTIGERCLAEVNGNDIRKKFGIEPGIELGMKLREERIKWMKEYKLTEK